VTPLWLTGTRLQVTHPRTPQHDRRCLY